MEKSRSTLWGGTFQNSTGCVPQSVPLLLLYRGIDLSSSYTPGFISRALQPPLLSRKIGDPAATLWFSKSQAAGMGSGISFPDLKNGVYLYHRWTAGEKEGLKVSARTPRIRKGSNCTSVAKHVLSTQQCLGFSAQHPCMGGPGKVPCHSE